MVMENCVLMHSSKLSPEQGGETINMRNATYSTMGTGHSSLEYFVDELMDVATHFPLPFGFRVREPYRTVAFQHRIINFFTQYGGIQPHQRPLSRTPLFGAWVESGDRLEAMLDALKLPEQSDILDCVEVLSAGQQQ